MIKLKDLLTEAPKIKKVKNVSVQQMDAEYVGDVDFKPVSKAWVYKKDQLSSEGDDNAHIRNVVFTPVVIATPPEPVAPEPVTPAPAPLEASSTSSSGSIAWWSLIIMVISLRIKCRK